MDDSVARFWDKYIAKTVDNNVPEGARRWYVKHVEAFIKSAPDRRLAETTREQVEEYVEKIDRMESVKAWQMRQLIDAQRILFCELVHVSWANDMDWLGFLGDVRDLPLNHATLARAELKGGGDK